jgi:hypothetical protein
MGSAALQPRGQFAMRALLVLFALWLHPALGQIPDQGRFEYVLYDNGDRPVGTYFFTIAREGHVWRISSEMNVDTRFFLFRIRLQDQNSFTHDGRSFQSFHVKYLKDVPLSTLQLEVSGVRNGNDWIIQTNRDGTTGSRQLSPESFEEVRNLVSRLVRPEAVLRPGQARKSLSLDPLSLEISEVETRGVEVESIEFQGRRRELFVMEISASDGDAKVKKFSNDLSLANARWLCIAEIGANAFVLGFCSAAREARTVT